MDIINHIINVFFSFLLFPFRNTHVWFGIIFTGTVTAVMMLCILKYFSDQKKIYICKERIIAFILEMRLFNYSVSHVLTAQRGLFGAVSKYTFLMFKPMLAGLIPFLVLIVQLNLHYGYEPLRPGDQTILTVQLSSPQGLSEPAELSVPDGIIVETPALRVTGKDQIVWRLMADKEGLYEISVKAAGSTFEKQINISSAGQVSPFREGRNFFHRVLYPGEKTIPQGEVLFISIDYSARQLGFLWWSFHWIYGFILVTLIAGFMFKSKVGVEF